MTRSKLFHKTCSIISIGLVIYLGALLAILVGCRPVEAPIEPEFVDTSFLLDEPCEPPCWYGLIPGESTEDQLDDVLSTLPFVEKDSVRKSEHVSKGIIVDGKEVDYNCKGAIGGFCGYVIVVDKVIQMISHEIMYALPLETVIEKLGKPDYVYYTASSPHGDGCFVMLDWQERAIIAEILDRRKRQTCIDLAEGKAFDADMLVTGLIYQSKEAQIPDQCGKLPCVPWPGFADR
jgi:hypothetical protein